MDLNSTATPTQAGSVKTVAIVLGSKNDWPIVEPVIKQYTKDIVRIDVSVISCHRNPLDILKFVGECCRGCFDVVICAGGKALALPGDVDAWIHAFGGKTPVIGVALGKSGTNEGLAALLSIEQIPGQPVIMDDQDAYVGPDGLGLAIERVIANGLPALKERKEKPAERGIYRNF